MKTFIFAAALGLLLVSPALAQSYNPDSGKGTASPVDAWQSQGIGGMNAWAEEPIQVAPVRRTAPARWHQFGPHSPASCGGGSPGYNETCGSPQH